MKNSPIGIFDSGIGGLTVAHAIKEILPNESIIYFGDTKHLPYGEKSEKLIKEFSESISVFLMRNKCKAIIIACNSASAIAYDSVKKIAENIPVFNVIDPVIEIICNDSTCSNIGVIGTKATIVSNIYNRKIKTRNKRKNVYSLATPLLAPIIEEGFIKEIIGETIIQNYLSDPKIKCIDSLILACTHYPLIQNEINNFYNGNIKLIDSVKIVSRFILKELKKLNLLNIVSKPEYHFYVSDYTKSFEESARFFFKEEIQLTQVNIHK